MMIKLSALDRDMAGVLFEAYDAIKEALGRADGFYLSAENSAEMEVKLDNEIARIALVAQQASIKQKLAALGIEIDDAADDDAFTDIEEGTL